MSHKTILLIYHSISYSHELQNNILGKFLSQYTNISDAKESNQNFLWVVGLETPAESYSRK
jgi:hypothetical protein